jgi:cation diffusion facilitator CzcD-associated flavoprotein CzcO
MTAAQLKAYGVESVVLDRNAKIGDNWASRYDSLRFHVPTSNCEMPYIGILNQTIPDVASV